MSHWAKARYHFVLSTPTLKHWVNGLAQAIPYFNKIIFLTSLKSFAEIVYIYTPADTGNPKSLVASHSVE